MYHVALDTDILRQDPQRRAVASRRLQQLVDEGHVRLHIADIVRREFLTGISADYRQALSSAHDNLKSLRQDFLEDIAPNLRKRLSDARKDISAKWQREFDLWCRTANVAVHDVPPSELSDVISSYFEGKMPFRAPKSRSDFPDALILATMRHVAAELGGLHFIVRDVSLSKAADVEPLITRHSSVDAFLMATYQELATRTDDRLFDLLFANMALLEGQAKSKLADYLDGKLLDLQALTLADASVTNVDSAKLFLKLPRAEKLGGGYFRFPFTATADVTVECDDIIRDWPSNTEDAGEQEEEAGIIDDRDDEPWMWGDASLRAQDVTLHVEGVLEVHVPYAGIGTSSYAPNEHLRRAMHTAEYEVVEVEIIGIR